MALFTLVATASAIASSESLRTSSFHSVMTQSNIIWAHLLLAPLPADVKLKAAPPYRDDELVYLRRRALGDARPKQWWRFDRIILPLTALGFTNDFVYTREHGAFLFRNMDTNVPFVNSLGNLFTVKGKRIGLSYAY